VNSIDNTVKRKITECFSAKEEQILEREKELVCMKYQKHELA